MVFPSVPLEVLGRVAGHVIPDREIPIGTPLAYELDADLKLVAESFSSQPRSNSASS